MGYRDPLIQWLFLPLGEFAVAEGVVEDEWEDEVEVGVGIVLEVMSADGCVAFDARSDSLYLAALT